MKKCFLIIVTALFLTTALFFTAYDDAAFGEEALPQSRTGEITVRNDSNKDLYISIAGRYQGMVYSGSSGTYRVSYGNHRVDAEWDEGSIYKYVSVSQTYPYNRWDIGQGDIY